VLPEGARRRTRLSHALGSLKEPPLHHGTLNAVCCRRCCASMPVPRTTSTSPAPSDGPPGRCRSRDTSTS
jgi:hypothetical protein